MEAISLLLRRGGDVNFKDRWEKTPIDEAKGNEEVLSLLNMDIDQLDSDSLSESD